MLKASLESSKSYLYLTKNDFVNGLGHQKTVIVAKDYRNIRFNFEGSGDSSLLLSNHKQASFRDLHIIGDVLRPTQLKLVNSDPKQSSDSNSLFCLDNMVDEGDTDADGSARSATTHKHKRCAIGQNLNISLFRRRLKLKKFLELEESEREQLATSVLNKDRFKDKSLFHFINEKQLVTSRDYDEADFINLSEPPDTDYEQSYSQQAPSIHDLFDIEVENPLEDTEEYEMMEYLEDEV